MNTTLEELISLLKEVRDDIDYTTEKALIDGNVLDSFDILQIVNILSEEYDISIPAKDIQPENFNSAEALLALVTRILEGD